jgi:hypothetical protein
MQTKAASRSGGGKLAIIILGVMGMGVAGGLVVLKGLGRAGKTDVGVLDALAPVQSRLRAVDACRIEYNLPAKAYYRDMYRRSVFLTPCGASGIAPPRATVKLPESWAHGALSFVAERSSVTDDWAILVDKEAVPFPALLAGLDELAPIVARDAPGALEKMRADVAEGNAKYEESQRLREEQQRRNQDSYPSR